MSRHARRLRVLLTNDDGILSPGLLVLRAGLMEIAEVEVVAPDGQRSGASHAVTLDKALHAEEVALKGERIGIGLDGYPVDCVKYALTEHLRERPDLVVSGINLGANLGVSVFYSGTVAAAIEASFFGIPAVAFSTDMNGAEVDCRPLAEIARGILTRLKGMVDQGQRMVLNVNFPALDPRAFRGLKVTRQGQTAFQDRFERREGKSGVWMAGEPGREGDDSLEIDVNAVRAGYISVTPLRLDLTDERLLEKFKGL